MNTLTCFMLLTYDPKKAYYSSSKPAFAIIAILIELEKNGYIFIDSDGKISVCSTTRRILPYQRMCMEIIDKNNLTSVKGILDFLLRSFTYKDMENIILELMKHISEDYPKIIEKGKYIVADELRRQAQGKLLIMLEENNNSEGITTAALLYGTRTLAKHLDKDSYKSVCAVVKTGIKNVRRPITKFILNNIDYIRGHVMGIVAN